MNTGSHIQVVVFKHFKVLQDFSNFASFPLFIQNSKISYFDKMGNFHGLFKRYLIAIISYSLHFNFFLNWQVNQHLNFFTEIGFSRFLVI